MPVEQIFIVWSPTGSTPPRRTHTSRAEAVRVAHQMAQQHPGGQFFVCEAVDVCESVIVRHTDLRAAACEAEAARQAEQEAEAARALAARKAAYAVERTPLVNEDGTHRNNCPCRDCDIPF